MPALRSLQGGPMPGQLRAPGADDPNAPAPVGRSGTGWNGAARHDPPRRDPRAADRHRARKRRLDILALHMTRSQAWLAPGLALTTFATLLVEILSTRLLSVLTWYHLSFLAVSLAMLGHGQRRGVRVSARRPRREATGRCGCSGGRRWRWPSPFRSFTSCTLVIPIPPLTEARLSLILPLAVSIVLLGVPFFLSGVAVTIALTRLGAPIGRLYAWDLAGAAAGCLLVIPLLVRTNLTSAMFTAAAATALAAWCFARVAGRRHRGAIVLAALLLGVAGWNAKYNAFPVLYPEEPGALADGRQRGR